MFHFIALESEVSSKFLTTPVWFDKFTKAGVIIWIELVSFNYFGWLLFLIYLGVLKFAEIYLFDLWSWLGLSHN